MEQKEVKPIKKVTNPAESYRKVLYNYDLEIAAVVSKSEFFNSQLKYYEQNKTSDGEKKYYGAVINLRKLQAYLIELKKGRDSAWQRLEKVIDNYKPRDKKIWYMRFIQGMTFDEISAAVSYDRRHLIRTVQEMKEELISFIESDNYDTDYFTGNV